MSCRDLRLGHHFASDLGRVRERIVKNREEGLLHVGSLEGRGLNEEEAVVPRKLLGLRGRHSPHMAKIQLRIRDDWEQRSYFVADEENGDRLVAGIEAELVDPLLHIQEGDVVA